MIDIKLKQTALQNLAKTTGDLAENALKKEAEKIARVLEAETQYDIISAQIELLDTISYRVYEKAIGVFSALLERLKTLELTYQEIVGYPVERLRELNTKEDLVVSILKALQHIRYHNTEKILDLFFQYSIDEESKVRKQAIAGIDSLAGYDLDIFYGDGKEWQGLGWQPQEKVLAKIESYNQEQKKRFLQGILAACRKMLSPTAEGTQWSYNKVVISNGALPANEGIKALRLEVLEILKTMYRVTESVDTKRQIISVMKTATRTPHSGNYEDNVLKMIIEDTIVVLRFMKEIAPSEDLQSMQKIEHDVYWLFYHMHELDHRITQLTIEIRDFLMSDQEYQKFRVLIGFESIFHEWEKGKEQDNYEREKEFREAEALRFVRSIKETNYEEWKDRILRYASIKSNDMATFPYFGKFLENFGQESPVLAIRLLSEVADQLGAFLVPILSGAATTTLKPKVYELIADWVSQGKYLFSLARFFEFAEEINQPLLRNIFAKAHETSDLNTLSQIIGTVTAQFTAGKESLITDFMIPAIKALTQQKDARWIFGFWYRPQRSSLLAAVSNQDRQAILDNLFWLNEIDYQTEEILSKIADISPDLVIEFLCKRIAREHEKGLTDKYEAIPFDFHTLNKPLSKIPRVAVDIVRDQYDGDHEMFIYRGGKLLKNIFPTFPEEFAEKLIELVREGSPDNLLFVIAVLRKYEGQEFLHVICKELVRTLPEDSKLLVQVQIILQTTGVVCGAHGFSEAYQRKIEEIRPWLEDGDKKIRKFASNYISGLKKQIEAENKRAEEDIILRKHQYGEESSS